MERAQAYKPYYIAQKKFKAHHTYKISLCEQAKKYGHAVKNEDDISKFYTSLVESDAIQVPRSAVRAYKTAFVYVQK